MKKSKIITGITLFIFFSVIISVITAGLLRSGKSQKTLGAKIEVNSARIKLTTSEVVKHDKTSDCWMIISNNVYNFTSFLSEHPGGELIMIPFCGKDATFAFKTMGGLGRSHSHTANSLMQTYLLGPLE